MDIRKVRKLIELLKETGVGEIEIHEGDDSVRISLHGAAIPNTNPLPITPPPPAPATPSTTSMAPSGHPLKAPMVGTVYLSPKPGANPFVEIGQRVKPGDTLCIIEAMKMYNKIEADAAGIISARLIENEQPVEFDQPLFIIDNE